MEDYPCGSHTAWDCKYHLARTTTYLDPVLLSDVGLRCRELLRETSRGQEMTIYARSVNRDQLQMLIGTPPQKSVSQVVQYLNGKSFRKLLGEQAGLRERDWGSTFGHAVIGWQRAAM